MTARLKENKKTHFIEQWVKDYYSDLYLRAKFKTGDAIHAEDLVQETFLAAWKGYSNFKGESTPKTWLFQILNNKIADHFRKTYQSPVDSNFNETQFDIASQFDAYGNWEPNGFENNWEAPNLLDDVQFNIHFTSCIGHLPDLWAGIITDKYINGKKTALICQENQISKTNYWQVMHRAKLMLKKCIEKFFKE